MFYMMISFIDRRDHQERGGLTMQKGIRFFRVRFLKHP